MKYPTSIVIRGYTYTVAYVTSTREVNKDFSEGFIGSCGNFGIRVYAGQEWFGILDTLIHETLHALISKNRALRLAFRQEEGVEENFVESLATDLARLLVDNGWVTETKQKPPITKRILESPK